MKELPSTEERIWSMSDHARSIADVIRTTGGAVTLCSVTTIIGYSSLLVARNQARPVYLLDALADTLPAELWLTRMEEKGQNLRLVGTTYSSTTLSDFMARLSRSRAGSRTWTSWSRARISPSRRARSPSRWRAGSRSEP